MKENIFGYLIGGCVHFDLEKKALTNVNTSLRNTRREQVVLRDTMFHLLVFLIQNNGRIIKNEDILFSVWDSHGLSSSSQRLWQVMQALKIKLKIVGVPNDFIMRVDSKGYYIRESFVTTLCSV